MNAIRENEAQKSFSKMIQNFKNLFHQEFMKIFELVIKLLLNINYKIDESHENNIEDFLILI